MKIHEYQGKEILRAYNVPVPRGMWRPRPRKRDRWQRRSEGSRWVVKAQIHAGGRGKGGGVQCCSQYLLRWSKSLQHSWDRGWSHHRPVQKARIVQRVLIEEGCDIAQELYCGIVIDRQLGQPVCMVSPVGGMDIEAVAATTPDQIFRESIDVLLGLAPFQARRLVEQLKVGTKRSRRCPPLLRKLYDVFHDKDCTLLEINPLVLTGVGIPLVLDVKMEFDDNALFRHPDVLATAGSCRGRSAGSRSFKV